MKKSKYFHNCTSQQQEKIVEEIKKIFTDAEEKILDSEFDEQVQESIYKESEERLKLFWEKQTTVKSFPDSFLDFDNYAQYWEDYFGLSCSDVLEMLIEFSEEHEINCKESEIETIGEWSQNR